MQRISFLDYTRVFACFLVMLVHACEFYYPVSMTETMLADESSRLWVSVYDGFSRMAVPLFMIVSAFLLVPMREDETAFQFYRNRLRRILPPFFIFMVLYAVLPMAWGQFDAKTALEQLIYVPLNFPGNAGHLWFIFPLIGLYLFIPVISPWLRKATKREELFFVILFLISTCMPYLNFFVGEVWGQCLWNEYHTLWYFSGYLGYMVLAHYIHKHIRWSTRRRLITGAVAMTAGAVVTILSFYVQTVPGRVLYTPTAELGWSFCTINCVLLTFGAFLMLTCIRKPSPAVTGISKLSYGMYLMHIFWLWLWGSIIQNHLDLPVALEIPAIAIATFFTCVAVTKLLSLLPGSYYTVGVKTTASR